MSGEIDEAVRYIADRTVEMHPHENSHAGSAVATGDELRSARNQLFVSAGESNLFIGNNCPTLVIHIIN